MVRIKLTTTGWRPGKVLAWSGFVASAVLLVSWFNAVATTTLDAPPSLSLPPIGAVTEGDDATTRIHATTDNAPCYMLITPSPYPEPNPCEP